MVGVPMQREIVKFEFPRKFAFPRFFLPFSKHKPYTLMLEKYEMLALLLLPKQQKIMLLRLRSLPDFCLFFICD
jgi:hypothetical protein